MTVIYGLESASLDFNSEVYCIAICNSDESDNIVYANYPPISEGLERLKKAKAVWGWNNLSFDSWLLKKTV
jgi:hypothetical protein